MWSCTQNDDTFWTQFWDSLELFNNVCNEIHWAGRLNPHNHSPLFPYLVTCIGDTFPVGSVGGQLNDVLFQPKYADEVFKALVLIDHLGNYRWFGGLECGARSDTRILRQWGPTKHQFEFGEAVLFDGGFAGRPHAIIPYPKPPKQVLPQWCAKYNDGHAFIRARVEQVFCQLWNWGVCREVFRKHGDSIEDRLQRIQWLVRAVVHIQQFINFRNVRYEPYKQALSKNSLLMPDGGPWPHFPPSIFNQPDCKRDGKATSCKEAISGLQLKGKTPVHLPVLTPLACQA